MNYKVYQGEELKQTVTSKTAVINGLQPNKTYDFSVQPNNGKRDGTKVTKYVTTRGIRFNIPKTLTVGSNITLRYEEYPLGIVPIGNEPSGMFGGGSKQNLSAKVISTANGNSVVEVAGNVIDVGGRNLIAGTSSSEQSYTSDFSTVKWIFDNPEWAVSAGSTYTYSIYVTKLTGSFTLGYWGYDSNKKYVGWFYGATSSSSGRASWTFTVPSGISYITPHVVHRSDNFTCTAKEEKLEQGDISTPYASFVDGDTFTAQPDGTCALFSEYKALYY